MEAYEVPKECWAYRLAPQLTGKAQQAYAAVSSDSAKKYDEVKTAILRRYNINEETYRSAKMEIKLGSDRMVVTAAVADCLPVSVLLGVDVPDLGKLLHGEHGVMHSHGVEEALVVTTRSRARQEERDELERAEKEAMSGGGAKTTRADFPTPLELKGVEGLINRGKKLQKKMKQNEVKQKHTVGVTKNNVEVSCCLMEQGMKGFVKSSEKILVCYSDENSIVPCTRGEVRKNENGPENAMDKHGIFQPEGSNKAILQPTASGTLKPCNFNDMQYDCHNDSLPPPLPPPIQSASSAPNMEILSIPAPKDKDFRAIVGDFGFSLELPQQESGRSQITAPVMAKTEGYFPPEIISGKISTLSDVYSCGVLCHTEDERCDIAKIKAIADTRVPESISDQDCERLQFIINSCLSRYTKRPANKVLKMLESSPFTISNVN
uniref:Protein kinase domain-containing protein n=1 Tax=Amphimedon queenslandica TaxID=400682 RepID=A0A1X7VDJ8_AMPQE